MILGANGAMGVGSGEVFAAAGIRTTLLARTRAKAEQGRQGAQRLAKAEAIASLMSTGSYAESLAEEIARADLILEAVSEELELKRDFFARVDEARRDDAIVATVSSGLSIAEMCRGRSEGFRRNFLGIHLFNPPHVIVGCEVIPHAETDPGVTHFVMEFLSRRLGRKVIRTTDSPAFAGNRIGFRVLNEVAQLAEEHGVAFMDALIGPHTGRAMTPLATIDFVGWDVHRAIVDNLRRCVADEATQAFVLPPYMAALIEQGHLGQKTPERGGFFRRAGGGDAALSVLDPATGSYLPAPDLLPALPDFVAQMKTWIRIGCYRQALEVMAAASGPEAELMRRVVLGYISYALHRVGEVVEHVADVDRIMGFGFHWAPPGVLVDLLGAGRVISLLERARIPVPSVLAAAAAGKTALFAEPHVDPGKFFFAH